LAAIETIGLERSVSIEGKLSTTDLIQHAGTNEMFSHEGQGECTARHSIPSGFGGATNGKPARTALLEKRADGGGPSVGSGKN
jgi:hypothetical protein